MTMPVPADENPLLASVRSAFEIMAMGAPKMAHALIDVATNPNADPRARVSAAEAVLSRVGLPAQIDVGLNPSRFFASPDDGPVQVSPASQVRSRLDTLRQQAIAQGVEGPASVGNVVHLFPATEETDIPGEIEGDTSDDDE